MAPGVTPAVPVPISAEAAAAAKEVATPSSPRGDHSNENDVMPAAAAPTANGGSDGASSAQVEELRAQISSLEQKLSKKSDEVKDLSRKLKAAESGASSSRGADARVRQMEEELLAAKEAHEKDIAAKEKIEAEYKEIKKAHAGCGQRANIQVTLLQDQIAKLEEEVEYHKKNVQIEIFNKEQVEEELDTVKKEQGRLQTELKAIQNAATKKAHEATALQRNVSSATEEKQQLKSRV